MLDTVTRDAISVYKHLSMLPAGDLAQLRRADKTGCPAFWQLASKFTDTVDKNPARWIYIVASLAEFITADGMGRGRTLTHDFKAPLGMLLATGGIQHQGRTTKPLLSEVRLAHLTKLRGTQRCQQFHRVMKMVKSRSHPPYRINVGELAWAILDEKSGFPDRKIAREYYRHVQ